MVAEMIRTGAEMTTEERLRSMWQGIRHRQRFTSDHVGKREIAFAEAYEARAALVPAVQEFLKLGSELEAQMKELEHAT